jgi:hypothetical protein
MFKVKFWLIAASVIIVDYLVYAFWGLMLMRYDDTYDESKGNYWGWDTLTIWDKFAVIGIQVWNVMNIALVIYIVYKAYKWYTSKRHAAI